MVMKKKQSIIKNNPGYIVKILKKKMVNGQN